MKIVIISDTHNKHRTLDEVHGGLPAGDVLIHCGDATLNGSLQEWSAFCNWFRKQLNKFRYLVFLPGNHDFCCQKDFDLCKNILTDENPGILMHLDQAFTID